VSAAVLLLAEKGREQRDAHSTARCAHRVSQGVRRLASFGHRVQVATREYVHRVLWAMAAAYLFRIARNHPFVDGNKRTALLAALVFLDLTVSHARQSPRNTNKRALNGKT
jgi:death-on-curing family protein